MDSLFGDGVSCERSIWLCLDTLAIWNKVDNTSELTAQHICHLQSLGARLCWWVVRWSTHEVEMHTPAGPDVQLPIQSCVNLIIGLAHDLAISHGDMEITERTKALDKRTTYTLDQNVELRSKDDRTSTRREHKLILPNEEVAERSAKHF